MNHPSVPTWRQFSRDCIHVPTIAFAAFIACLTAAPRAVAQCDPAWTNFPGGDLASFGVATGIGYAALVWDDDGPGPHPPALYVGGTFVTAGSISAPYIAKWDSTGFHPLGSGMNNSVFCLTTFDPDGPGPLAEVLIAAGDFTTAGGVTVNRIAAWNGTAWSALGAGFNSTVRALAIHDPDGPGPGLPALYAAGAFSTAGGVSANRVARWNGSNWAALGSGLTGGTAPVYALASFDADANGPALPVLVAGGAFTTAGGNAIPTIARWNGSNWAALGTGIPTGTVYALTVFDEDDAGPTLPALFAGGEFTNAGGSGANRVAKWNGAAWSPLVGTTAPPGGTVYTLASIDLDGPGGDPAALYAGGLFTTAGASSVRCVVHWDGPGHDWSGTTTGPSNTIYALAPWSASGPASLYAVGALSSVAGIRAVGIARLDASIWSRLGTGITSTLPGGVVQILTAYDRDGIGAQPSVLIVSGGDIAGNISATVAAWNGAAFTAIDTRPRIINAMSQYDPDGDGPQPNMLYAGGESIGTAATVTRWDDATWSNLDNPAISGAVYAMTTFDDDGPGPHQPLLVVGGHFAIAGTQIANIASWNGTAWSAIGAGLNGYIYALASYDDDDDGPHTPMLYAAGYFPGPPYNRDLMRWDGATWTPVGTFSYGGSSYIGLYSLAVGDLDGPGPLHSALFVGGPFTGVNNTSAFGVAQWNGASWSAMGAGLPPGPDPSIGRGIGPWALTAFDDDVDGPNPPVLYAGGDFVNSGSNSTVKYLARWNPATNAWTSAGPGMDYWVRTLAVFDDDSLGPHPPALYSGGDFNQVAGLSSERIVRWGRPLAPAGITSQPAPLTVVSGDAATFTVTATGAPQLTYQWRKDGNPLSDGGAITGASTPSLAILSAQASDGGLYDVAVSNACGGLSSTSALLTIVTCPPAPTGDMNFDGWTDAADIEAFVTAITNASVRAADLCFGDFSADGTIDAADLPDFIALMIGG